MVVDVIPDVPVYHHFRNHITLFSVKIDVDSNKLQEAGMRKSHPDDRLLAKELD